MNTQSFIEQITLGNMGYVNEMWLGVFERFFRAGHESGLKSCPSRIAFEKIWFETPKKCVFGNFWITVGTKPGVLEPSWISQIEAYRFRF